MKLSTLREANVQRQIEWPGDDKTDLAFRAIEVFGEAGELAEAVKKFRRYELGIAGSTSSIQDIKDEMGDVLIALDLLANHLGVTLEDCVSEKFNKTSEKYGFKTRLEPTQ